MAGIDMSQDSEDKKKVREAQNFKTWQKEREREAAAFSFWRSAWFLLSSVTFGSWSQAMRVSMLRL
jgi:hypothetical protein